MMFTHRKSAFLFIIISCLVIIGCSEIVEKKGFPIFLQETTTDCGPSCLKMITQYYDLDVSLDELKRLSSYDNNVGTSLLGLSNALDSLKINNKPVMIPYEDLLYKAPLPAIIHWGSNHFVLVYKMKRDEVWVADPVLGDVQYSRDEFCDKWLTTVEEKESKKAIVLIFDPPSKFN